MLRISGRTFSPRFSAFLMEAESALAEKYLHFCGYEDYMLYGGFEGAERVMLGVFPEYDPPSEDAFPIRKILFYGRAAGNITHRDCLGCLMGLGITRDSVGDIICTDEGVYAVLTPAAAELAMTIEKIGRSGVKCRAADDDAIARNDSFAEISGTVASMRLDCIVSTALNISREKAARLIRSGAVSVNHGITESVSELLNQGDVLSVKSSGRFILADEGGRTRKDRLHVTIKKYL